MKSATDQSAFASSAVYYITHNDSLQVHLHSVSVWDQAECNSFPTMQWKTKWRCWELNLRTSKSSLDKLSQTQTIWVSLKHFDPGLILEPWIWFTRPVQTVSVKSKPAQTRWDRFKRSESGLSILIQVKVRLGLNDLGLRGSDLSTLSGFIHFDLHSHVGKMWAKLSLFLFQTYLVHQEPSL